MAGQTIIKAGGFEPGAWPEAWRYADTGLPMISSADGFYFMEQANRLLEGGVGRADNFSRFTAALARISSQPVEIVAFYTSLLFHLALGLLAVAWGRLLNGGRFSTFLACVAAGLMPAWLERAGPSRFDTDLPILLFWQVGLFFLVKASLCLKKGSPGVVNLVLALLSFIIMGWFWKSGLGFAAGSLLVWAFLFTPYRFFSFKARLATGAVLLAWLSALVILPPEQAPAPTSLLIWISDHFTLAFGGRAELFYSSIKELYPLSFAELMEKTGGSLWGGLAFMAAAALAVWKLPPLRLPVLLGFICIFAGLRSNRLVYLGLFPLALSAGFLPAVLSNLIAGRSIARRLYWAAGAGLWAVMMYSCVVWGASRDLDIRWEGAHDRLVEELRQETGAETAGLWNWWDDGYFLAARTKGMKPLFDGGNQTHTMAYIAAHPFMMDDRRAAARWMRFFAIRGEAGLEPLRRVWGRNEAWDKLETVLKVESPEEAAEYLAEIPGGVDWVFPPGRVYWYMPGYFVKISNWWIALGLSREPDKNLVKPHIEKIERDKFFYDAEKKSLTITQDLWDRGYKNFGMVFNTGVSPLSPPWPSGGSPYIIFSDNNHRNAYITDELGIRSLPLYMLVPGGQTPPNFRPLAVDYDWGGVWEILP
ncbi:hypothetical protein C4J81_19165 (plasmid) [Deltaproteobacteria bacterium Smac51]|nr:hypothetical protein C4J81_19165 [Deltaproteobacteria bacterium Smac51]